MAKRRGRKGRSGKNGRKTAVPLSTTATRSLARRFLVWVGSGIAAVVGATSTAYVAGALQAVLPATSDTICRYVGGAPTRRLAA